MFRLFAPVAARAQPRIEKKLRAKNPRFRLTQKGCRIVFSESNFGLLVAGIDLEIE